MLNAHRNTAEFAGDDDPLPVNFDFDRAPADALESLDARKTGERISWNWRDTWQEQHREAFVVAKMAKADMLKEVHDSLHEAMEKGIPYAEWRKQMEACLQDRWIGKTLGELWDELPEEEKKKRPRPEGAEAEKRIEASRLRTIYYTNSIVSHQAGQYKQLMKQAEDYPYWRYITAGDSRVRASHQALHNKVFRYNDPIWDTHYPPNGWFCRCSVEALDDYDLKHLEGTEIKVEDGGSHVSWITRPNGDRVAVWKDGDQQVECAPGWSYNVARPGYRQQVAEEKAKEYPIELRKQIAEESAKEDQEQSERTKKLEEIAERLEEQRKKRKRLRVEVVRNPHPSETPLKLQRQFQEEENALIAQHRGQERFEAIASGDRKLMRELRKAEEDALAELRERQRQRLEEAQRQAQTVKPLEKQAGLDGAKGQPKAQAKPEKQGETKVDGVDQVAKHQQMPEQQDISTTKLAERPLGKSRNNQTAKTSFHKDSDEISNPQSRQYTIPNFIPSTYSDENITAAEVNDKAENTYQNLIRLGEDPPVNYESCKPVIDIINYNVSLRFNNPGYASIEEALGVIQKYTTEHDIAFSSEDKKAMFEIAGGQEGEVDIPNNISLINCTVIHNHPNNSLLSPEDINTAIKYKFAYLIVICPNGNVFKVNLKAGGSQLTGLSYYNHCLEACRFLDPSKKYLQSEKFMRDHASEIWEFLKRHYSWAE